MRGVFCVFLLCFVMALKSYLETFESCHQWLRLQFSVCYLRSVSVSQMTKTASASEARRAALALQHVIMALVVVVISVVIEIRTVIGSRYQGEGPFVVVGVQWFLLNADVMHSWQRRASRAAVTAVAVSMVHRSIHLLADGVGQGVEGGTSNRSSSV